MAQTFYWVILPVATAAALWEGISTCEGDVFPEKADWERRLAGTFGADRWLDAGWFVQFVDLPDGWAGPLGNADFYRRPITDFVGSPSFFVEWRVITDTPSSVLEVNATPVVVSASGSGAANYHFTITDTRVQVWRSNLLPILFVDITGGIPHTYRIELFGDQLFAWYIDGQLGDSGIPQGPYPNEDSFLIWGVRRHTFDATTRWDYIRFGVIPEDGSGDYDSDGRVDLFDYYLFHECLSNHHPGIHGGPGGNAGPGCRFADFDSDSDTDLADLASFQINFSGE